MFGQVLGAKRNHDHPAAATKSKMRKCTWMIGRLRTATMMTGTKAVSTARHLLSRRVAHTPATHSWNGRPHYCEWSSRSGSDRGSHDQIVPSGQTGDSSSRSNEDSKTESISDQIPALSGTKAGLHQTLCSYCWSKY